MSRGCHVEDIACSRPTRIAARSSVLPAAPGWTVYGRVEASRGARVQQATEPVRMIAILGVFLAVATAQTSDLVTFLAMMSVHGPAAEANPLVGQAYIAFGVPAVVLFKVALIAFVVATFAIVARRYKRLA